MAFKTTKEQISIISKVMQKDETIPYYRFRFGKYKGCTLEYVFNKNKDYLIWLSENISDLDQELTAFIHDKVI